MVEVHRRHGDEPVQQCAEVGAGRRLARNDRIRRAAVGRELRDAPILCLCTSAHPSCEVGELGSRAQRDGALGRPEREAGSAQTGLGELGQRDGTLEPIGIGAMPAKQREIASGVIVTLPACIAIAWVVYSLARLITGHN